MKIAICFSGSIRDFTTCLPSIRKYFLDNLNGDIFLHLWRMDNVGSLSSDVNFKWKNDTCETQYVIDQLKPIKYVVDKYSNDWETKIINESNIDIKKFEDNDKKNYGINACGMYYKIQKCFELVESYCLENNCQYDLIIRARLDFIWEDYIKISDFQNIDNNYIYLIKDRYATHSKIETNDKFFAGTFDVMKKMCYLFSHLKEYQDSGITIEGQTLHEIHIKSCNLKVVWIGHKHTYYKCMGRHQIRNNRGSILIDNNDELFENFMFELSYYLLYNKYSVFYKNDRNTDILKLFSNFKIYDNHKENFTYYLSTKINNSFKGPQIILSFDETNKFDEIKNNLIKININQNICIEDLIDFVVSMINSKTKNGTYNFTETKMIDDIEPEEHVIIKLLDRGYYLANMVAFNKKIQEYSIKLNGKIVASLRSDIKIVNLLKYHQKLKPECMPTNQHRKKTLISNNVIR